MKRLSQTFRAEKPSPLERAVSEFRRVEKYGKLDHMKLRRNKQQSYGYVVVVGVWLFAFVSLVILAILVLALSVRYIWRLRSRKAKTD